MGPGFYGSHEVNIAAALPNGDTAEQLVVKGWLTLSRWKDQKGVRAWQVLCPQPNKGILIWRVKIMLSLILTWNVPMCVEPERLRVRHAPGVTYLVMESDVERNTFGSVPLIR